VQLLISACKPATAALGQLSRLRQLLQAEYFAEEPARLLFAARGGGNLYVVDTKDHTELWQNHPFSVRQSLRKCAFWPVI